VLRSVLEVLHARGVESGRVRYLKDGGLTGGISIGGGPSRIVTPVVFRDVEVGVLELAVDDLAFAERVATLISAHVSAASPSPARNGPADLPP
jgi:hypothetical protein